MRETELYEELYKLGHKEIGIVLEENIIYVIPNKKVRQNIIEDIFEISKKHGAVASLENYAGRFEIKF